MNLRINISKVLNINVKGDITGKEETSQGALVKDWLKTAGSPTLDTTWWVTPDKFKQSSATLGGGDISLKSGGSINQFSETLEGHLARWFDTASEFKKKNLGVSMIDNIIINTVAPVLFAYGNYHDENKYKQKALKWLEETAAEKNVITKGFQQLGIENKTAFDSQALIELKNEYCLKKRCLECGVGNAILKG